MSFGLAARGARALFVLGAMTLSSASFAQTLDCPSLRARIDSATTQGARAGQYAAALRRQDNELQRLQDYADSVGCNADFLFNANPAQCDAITSRMARLQATVDRLQQQMDQARVEDPQALTERYNAYCTGTAVPAQGEEVQEPRTVMPIDPDAAPVPLEGDEAAPPVGRPRHVRALCVRACDGGFFPITEDARSDATEDLDRLCQAMCPNTKAILYTAAPLASIETAVDKDGTPYTQLPAAFRFQKTYNATCSCKPPHQSWVEALAAAEALIETRRDDVTVTQKMSDAMARPGAPLPGKAAPGPKSSAKTKAARQAKLPPPNLAVPVEVDPPPPIQPETAVEDLMRQLRRGGSTL